MKLSSNAFNNGEYIPQKYSGYGEDISPQLKIDDIPSETKSLVLIVEDPDSPGRVWQHWLMWNIPRDINEIEEGKIPPEAVEGKNDFGRKGYGGPMPHSGTHHYQFKLFALSENLDLGEGANRQELDVAMEGLVIDQTELVGLFSTV